MQRGVTIVAHCTVDFYHCWHPFAAPRSQIHFCCREGCKDVMVGAPGVAVEEKSHGGVLFTGMGAPVIHTPTGPMV